MVLRQETWLEKKNHAILYDTQKMIFTFSLEIHRDHVNIFRYIVTARKFFDNSRTQDEVEAKLYLEEEIPDFEHLPTTIMSDSQKGIHIN